MNIVHTLFFHYLQYQEKFCQWLLILLGILMTILILLQIFFRFVVYVPFPWSEECVRYMMIWMGMLGSVLALRKGGHIGVMFFVEKLPQQMQTVAKIIVQCLLLIFLMIFCRQAVEFAHFNSDQLSPAMEISMLVPYASLPLGAFMMIMVLLNDLLKDLLLFFGFTLPNPAEVSS